MTDLTLKRHVGVLNNTGTRVVVVFRKIPGDEKFCLVVESDRLPERYHDSLHNIVNSIEGQSTVELSEVLNRHVFSDGQNALQALHYGNYLRRTPVDIVTLYPKPGRSLPLALLNAEVDGKMDQYMDEYNKQQETEQAQAQVKPADVAAIAQGLLIQAELLEADAKQKREEAYGMMPELRPVPVQVEVKVEKKPRTGTKAKSTEKSS